MNFEINDETELLKAENRLLKAELELLNEKNKKLEFDKLRLDVILGHVPIVLWSADTDGIFTSSVGLGLDILGLKPGQVVGASIFDIYHEFPDIIGSHEKTLEGSESLYEFELEGIQYIEKGIKIQGVSFDAKLLPILDENNQVTGLIGVARNISTLKSVENTLDNLPISVWQQDFSAVKHYFDALQLPADVTIETYLDDNPDVVKHCYGLIKIIDVNLYTLKLYGAENKADLLDNSGNILSDTNYIGFKKGLIAIYNKVPNFKIELKQKTRTGAEMDTVLNWYIPEQYQSSMERVYITIQDLTDQKRNEALLIQSQKMEAIGRLAGGITHDFKNIMSVISLNADYLLTSLSDQDELKSEVMEIQKSVKIANSITKQLLTFSKNQKTDFVLLNPTEVISKLQNWLNRLLGTQYDLSVNIKNKDIEILANSSMLEQVLLNLINNSKDAMPEGGEIGLVLDKVSITNRDFVCDECKYGVRYGLNYIYLDKQVENGDYFSIHFQDDGIGMGEDTSNYIFEPFYTTKIPGKGTGLGLSTVYGIINDFTGHIGVASKINEGTTFHILIPLFS